MVLRTECMVHHWPLALIMSTSLAKAALCAINFKPEHSLKICGEKGGACPSAEKYFIIRQIRDIIRDKSSKICFCATKTRSALTDWRSCEGFHPSTRPELRGLPPLSGLQPWTRRFDAGPRPRAFVPLEPDQRDFALPGPIEKRFGASPRPTGPPVGSAAKGFGPLMTTRGRPWRRAPERRCARRWHGLRKARKRSALR